MSKDKLHRLEDWICWSLEVVANVVVYGMVLFVLFFALYMAAIKYPFGFPQEYYEWAATLDNHRK